MNRELNPRAWSIDGECWCTMVYYDGHKKEWSGIVPVLAPDNRSKRIGQIEDTNIIVEFPTGLKDKNNNNIYEGDIVKLYDRFVSVITWQDNYCGFKWFDKGDGYCGLDKDNKEYYEIIGNIHENPELIGEK